MVAGKAVPSASYSPRLRHTEGLMATIVATHSVQSSSAPTTLSILANHLSTSSPGTCGSFEGPDTKTCEWPRETSSNPIVEEALNEI